jgi:SAM-dependent methyltransferase
MTAGVPLYDTAYGQFELRARQRVRTQTYGQDIGQNGWLTTDEWHVAVDRLELAPGADVLDVACGSGGPALYLARRTGARIVGVDRSSAAIETASDAARREGLDALARFQVADGTRPLPFDDASFDAVVCIDAISHFPDRSAVLREWRRVLRPGGRVLFTDPIVVTGPVTSDEIALRSAIGPFVFSLLDENVRLVREAGFDHVRFDDTTRSVVHVARRWLEARADHRAELVDDEGEETYEGLQRFLSVVHSLAADRRLSRFTFLARALRPAPGA